MRCREKVKEARRERSQNNRPRPIIVIFCFLAVHIHPITVRLRQTGNSDDKSGFQQRKGELQINRKKSCRTKPWAIGSSPNGHGPLRTFFKFDSTLFTKMPAAKCQSSNYGTKSSRNSRAVLRFFSTDVQVDSYTFMTAYASYENTHLVLKISLSVPDNLLNMYIHIKHIVKR